MANLAMQFIVSDIIKDGPKAANAMQVNFDLLGQLLKFNYEVFLIFDALFSQHEVLSLSLSHALN